MNPTINIVFMGTASFAVPTLAALLDTGHQVLAVITSPDKPAGRGKKIRLSPVKEFALNRGLQLLQPPNLKDKQFVAQLKDLKPDLQVVVAFRMLPKEVWNLPRHGTINLHASLLPQYRGAAPINHAIFNGEKITGVTTFLIDDKIDTGKILKQRKIDIGAQETAGELHDRLMIIGSELVVETVGNIATGQFQPTPQDAILTKTETLKSAPKIFNEDRKIGWSKDVHEVYNKIRGLAPSPGAFTTMILKDGTSKILKILNAENPRLEHVAPPGTVLQNQCGFCVACGNGVLSLTEVQVEGKKKMDIPDFLRGFSIKNVVRLT